MANTGTKKFTLKSGKELVVTLSDFETADELKNAIFRELRGLKLDKSIMGEEIGELDLAGLMKGAGNPALLSLLIDKALQLGSSKDVKAALFACFDKATYAGARLSAELFDDPSLGESLRGDYFEVCVKVTEVNVGPFFAQTFSALKARLPTRSAIPA